MFCYGLKQFTDHHPLEGTMRRIVVKMSPEGDVRVEEQGQKPVQGQSFEVVVNGDCTIRCLEPSRVPAGN